MLTVPAAANPSGWSWSLPAWSAMVALGVLSTGLAFAAFITLIGRVGPRGSVAVYFIPVVAIGVGVALAGDSVAPLSLAGTALVLIGAWLTSRRDPTQPRTI